MFPCVHVCCLNECARTASSVSFGGRRQKGEVEAERTLQAEGRAFANLGRHRSSSMYIKDAMQRGPALSL